MADFPIDPYGNVTSSACTGATGGTDQPFSTDFRGAAPVTISAECA
jgi:hypothetical protein